MADKIGGKTTKMDGYLVRIPKKGLSATQKQSIGNRLSNPKGLKKSDACVLIAFPGGAVAQRCIGRTLAQNATSAQKAARKRFAKAAHACKGKGKNVSKCVKGKL